MSWVTIIWSMIASACLTLASIYFLVWCQRRTVWAGLLFSLTSTAVAVYTIIELWMMRAETPAEFATALRWLHVPVWVLILSFVGFVRLHFRAGRPWLAWTICALRTMALLLNFLVGQNLNYREVTDLRHIPFLGESVSTGVGVSSPCALVGQLGLLLLLVFVADAAITVWRRGERRKALATGGSFLFFALAAFVDSLLVFHQIVDWPLTASFSFLGIVVAMGYEMSHETLRAAKLADELRESEERITLAAEAAQFGVWGWNLARNQVWGSERWLRLFGFASGEDISFEKVIQRIHPGDREMVTRAIKRVLEEGADYREEFRIILPDGNQRWIASRGRMHADARGKPDRMLGAAIDITERRQSELEIARHRNELAHLSRVATVSELSGSLAHELNQPLGIILSNAQAAQELLLRQPLVLGEVSEILGDIVKADRRASDIIQRLRALLKRGEASLQPLMLNDLLEEVLRLVRADLIGRGVIVVCDLAPDLPLVMGDRVQLQQLALNLILNAADAMSANAPGSRRINLTTTRHQHTVRASVRDEGCGLPGDVEQLFQPFYTTKEHGLGMGLAICRSIITAHHGRLWAEPHPKRGAVIHFELPVADSQKHS